MSSRGVFAAGLARAMLAGAWRRRPLLERCHEATGVSGRWLRSLVSATLRMFPDAPLHDAPSLTSFVLGRHEITELRRHDVRDTRVRRWFV